MRIIAVTSDANLAVGLSLRAGIDIDVETVRGVADLKTLDHDGFDVALIALESTSRGILAAGVLRQHIASIPCVVVANAPPGELPPGVTVLKPPFDLDAVTDELQRAVREADEPSTSAAAAAETRPRAAPIHHADLDERTIAMRSSVATARAPTYPAPELPSPSASGPEPVDPPSPGVTAASASVSEGPPASRNTAESGSATGSDERDGSDPGPDPGSTERVSTWSRYERLHRGLVAANELQRLVDDIPQLNDRQTIADALVHEITDGLEGSVAVLWGPDGAGGFEALAWHGVPAAIADLKPAADQPLLRDALERDAVFLPADERRPGYLDGLPGVHGGTVMAAVLRADGETHGIVVVSGGSPTEENLIGVCALADEHAMALGIAANLELLRRRPAVDLRERWLGRPLG